jgi:hypothetical protein
MEFQILIQRLKSRVMKIQQKEFEFLTQNLDSKEGSNILKEQKFNKEDFDVLLEIKNRLGSGMKFEPRFF